MIKPDFWEDEKTGNLDFPEMCLYIGMWNFADDAGRIRYNPHLLRSQIFPYKDISLKQMEKWMQKIEPFLTIYVSGDTTYAEIKSWAKHQNINRPSASSYPAPEGSMIIHGAFSEDSVSAHAKKKGKEMKGSEKKEYAPSVFLSEEEYEKLAAMFGEATAKDKIETLSLGIRSKGYKYNDHYATILSWDRKDKRDKAKAPASQQPADHSPRSLEDMYK